MSLTGKQYTEAYFFDSFLKRAIDGEEKYLEIVKPIILESSEFANNKISLMKLNRKYLSFTIYLSKIKIVKKVTESNLLLSEIKSHINSDWENFCQQTDSI